MNTIRMEVSPTPRPLELVPFEPVQFQIRGNQSGYFCDVDIQQFFCLGALLLSSQHHHPGGALGGNVQESAGQIIGGKAKEDDCHKSQ